MLAEPYFQSNNAYTPPNAAASGSYYPNTPLSPPSARSRRIIPTLTILKLHSYQSSALHPRLPCSFPPVPELPFRHSTSDTVNLE